MAETTVCLTFDFDAVSPWLHSFEFPESPTQHSRGVFGADVGAPRILSLLEEYDLTTTWFVPGHTIDSFPEAAAEVYAKGHDVQHHGWSHTRPSEFESRAAERADIERGIESIVDLTGRKPTGYRSPSWDFSTHTLSILQSLDFEWDSSQMADDFAPYYVRENWKAPLDGPYERGTPTDIVEVPVSWQRDDFPALAFSRGKGYVDENSVFRTWRDQFDWLYDNVEGGVFVLTNHPQVMGQAHRVRNLEKLVQHFLSKPNVTFETVDAVASDFASR